MGTVDLSSSVNVTDFIEDNSVAREAHFYVYASKLQNVSTNLPAWKEFMHWGIIVEYPETKAVYTFDADTNGSLTGGEIIVGVRRSHPDKEVLRSKKELGVVVISPKDLVAHAKRAYFTGKQYNFIFQNCQSWAVRDIKLVFFDYTSNIVLKTIVLFIFQVQFLRANLTGTREGLSHHHR